MGGAARACWHVCDVCMGVCVRARGCAGTADGQGEQVCGVWGVCGVIGDQAGPGPGA